jgi:hypothetical protein
MGGRSAQPPRGRQPLNAEEITTGLMVRAFEGAGTFQGANTTYRGDMVAVETDLDRFKDQYEFFVQRDLPMPGLATADGSNVPVDAFDLAETGDLFEFKEHTRPPPHTTEGWTMADWQSGGRLESKARNILGELSESANMEYRQLSPVDAIVAFRTGLGRFVESFVNGGGQVGNSRPSTKLTVRVHTQKSGLTVHCSPAYLLKLRVYFGGLTSPAEGHIVPGLWRFLVASQTVRPTLDKNEYEVPPRELYLTVM